MPNPFLQSFILHLFLYILVLIFGSFFPIFFVITLLFLIFNRVSNILVLRIIIPILTFFILNQFLIHRISNIWELDSHAVYVSGLLFYMVIILLIKEFSYFFFSKSIFFMLIPLSLSFVSSIYYVDKSIVFLANVIGGFLILYYSISCYLKKVNIHSKRNFLKLEYDFNVLIIFISCMSIIFLILDLVSDLAIFKYTSQAVLSFRGNNEYEVINGIPKQFWTALFDFNYILRYSPFINDPIRSAYWNLYILFYIFWGQNYFKGKFIKSILFILFFVLFLINWSKGAYISSVLIMIFTFLLKRKYFIITWLFLIVFTLINIYFSSILKTSGIIHFQGLVGPFQSQNIMTLRYFFGNDIYQAGNMGRISGEIWNESVLRGAESLIGTYMYSLGLVGVILFLLMHYNLVRKLYNNNLFWLSSIFMTTLNISFLQEGGYNIFQCYILILISLFSIYRFKVIK